MVDKLESCPACGALPCDWVDNPFTTSEAGRVAALIAEVEAGRFDAIEAVADKWIEAAGVVRMMNAMASVFERHASQEIMDRFREKLTALMHLAFVEGAAQGVLQIKDARTPANGEQVEPDKLKTAYLALLTISQEDDGPLGRYAAKIARAVEPDATPTEDARSRVKVLEEALREVIDFAKVPNMSLSSDYYRGARMAWDVTAEIARTALGNKETDRHG